MPPTRSGVSDYAAELLPHLKNHCRVALLAPPDWQRPEPADWLAGIDVIGTGVPRPEGSIEVLHLGNNPYHLWIASRLRVFPAYVVLHDTVLHHLLVEEAAQEQNWPRFTEDLRSAYGEAGGALAEARRWGFTSRLDPFMFPARQALLRYAKGVIVHSQQGRRDVERDCPGVAVRCVPLPVGVLPGGDRKAWRTRLGVGEGELLLVHLGFLTREKGLLVILKALAAAQHLAVPFRLVIVGEGKESQAVLQLLSDTGLAERVRLWGYASETDLGGIVSAADAGLVPRYPTAGETSAAVLRFLAMGVPVFVAGYRQFLEFPTDAAFRIAPGEAGVVDLVRGLAWFSQENDVRQRAAVAARRAWEQGGHQPEKGAAALFSALQGMRDELAIRS